MPSRDIVRILAFTSFFLTTTALPVEKSTTYTNAKFTYEDNGGLGACGTVYSAAELVVALNMPQWNGGAYCGDLINISYNDKTAQAYIVDMCPGCPEYGLDLTSTLFTDLVGSLEDGFVYGSWSFV